MEKKKVPGHTIRKPMPKPSRPISTKKGIKGYDRKRAKREFAREALGKITIDE